ncbi:hypothetical protein ABPG72_021519 [Tetrahymena utriculariae]
MVTFDFYAVYVQKALELFSKFIDYKAINYNIIRVTEVEELYDKHLFKKTDEIDIQLKEVNFLQFCRISQQTNEINNQILTEYYANDGLTKYTTVEKIRENQPLIQISTLNEQFLFSYFDNQEDLDSEQLCSQVNKDDSSQEINNSDLKLCKLFLKELSELANTKIQDTNVIYNEYFTQLQKALKKNHILLNPFKSGQKRFINVLKLVAFTRNIDKNTSISSNQFYLDDFLIVPFLIAKSQKEYSLIEKLNLEVIKSVANIYGSTYFSPNSNNNFWLLSRHKCFLKQMYHLQTFHQNYIVQEGGQKDKSQLYYQVKGRHDILSNHFIPVDVNRKYSLTMDIRNSGQMLFYLGLSCFDENQNFIYIEQVLRIEDSAVIISGEDASSKSIIVSSDTKNNLKFWSLWQKEPRDQILQMGHIRSIGFYYEGDTNLTIPREQVIPSPEYVGQNWDKKCYSTSNEDGIYIDIQDDRIILNQRGWEEYQKIKDKGQIQFGKTKIMNHHFGDTFTYSEQIQAHIKDWMTKNYTFQGQTWGHSNIMFRKGTKYVKILILSDFKTDPLNNLEDLTFSWKNVEFKCLE